MLSGTETGQGVIAELGEKDGFMVKVKDGRFGAYVNWKKVNAKLPAEYVNDPSSLPLDEAWNLIVEKGGSGKAGNKSKKKGKSQVELPPAPKRPKSAYLHFCAEKRPDVAEKAKSLGEVSKELARLWAETKDRQPYEDLAAAGKAEYEEKKLEWQKKCQELLDKSSSSTAKKQSGSKKAATARTNGSPAPKRPMSCYLFFCADKRAEVSKKVKSLGDISKELARLWAETADDVEVRQKYQDMADADKKRYEEEMIQFNGVEENGKVAPKRNGKAAPKNKSAKKPSQKKASTRAPSAYMLFCGEFRKTIVDEQGEKLPFGETAKRLAKMWKECDDETRARFQEQAADAKKEADAIQLIE